jgi:hypothetical protein
MEPVQVVHALGGRRYYKLQQPDGTVKLISQDNGYRIMTVDLATSERQTGDYTVCAVCFATGEGELLVEHVERRRVEGPELLPLIESVFRQWEPSTISIESVGFQLSVGPDGHQAGAAGGVCEVVRCW